MQFKPLKCHLYTLDFKIRKCDVIELQFIPISSLVNIILFTLTVIEALLSGVDSLERDGIIWSLSKEDAPTTAISSHPRRASPGTVNTIGITYSTSSHEKVYKNCLKPDETFERVHGVKRTKMNCEGLGMHRIYPNCTIATFNGYKAVNDTPTCMPKNTPVCILTQKVEKVFLIIDFFGKIEGFIVER